MGASVGLEMLAASTRSDCYQGWHVELEGANAMPWSVQLRSEQRDRIAM